MNTPRSIAQDYVSRLRNVLAELDLDAVAAATAVLLDAYENGHTAVSYTHLTLPTTPYV